ncbi:MULTISPECIES: hypothetical protein [Burkholderia]|uniref:Uncharacterized protein n=1 Tax=Burkholderia cepacia TaxID=292 RepID=A0A8I1ATS7_BURCE|nr:MULTISPECIES: hypothetical protein [Burkholderia]HDR9767499.1 hypothetical protein [Burkholderia cepacia ATCC 25416]KAB1588964.1 hypothetical protein C5O75_025405 [Burkholderia cepacia]MBE2966512.1 hypothetical protein [Burkholderia cepacia]MBH9682068.1 hypothetical protein [Burkholderia cepacia]MBH9695669.1 hypothetical protein [Burkholderia cepacia]
MRLRDASLAPHDVSPATRVPAFPAGACAMVELRRFLFEDDRNDGNYSICVILCNVIELLSK